MANKNVHPIFKSVLDSFFPTPKPLEEMTAKELEETKQQWYNTAEKIGKLSACRLIGTYLGTPVRANWGPKYQFDKDDLSIYVDDYGGYMTAKFQGKLVMSTHSGERLYVPGPWETLLSDLLPLAEKKKKDMLSTRQENERLKLLNKLKHDE